MIFKQSQVIVLRNFISEVNPLYIYPSPVFQNTCYWKSLKGPGVHICKLHILSLHIL